MRVEIERAIGRVLDSGWFVLGPEHDALEDELARYVGVKHAVNVANGTDALELALAAVGVRQGDAVVTVANAGGYTSTVTLLLGAEPVYCDVDEHSLQMSADTLNDALRRLDRKPQAIVVTHLFGAMAPVEEIVSIARRNGIPLVEDCAQAMGARKQGRAAGSFGDIATTSFYPTKNLGALGDGGAVFTQSDDLAQRVRWMRQYGWDSKYRIEHSHGKNSRLDEIQAAILRVKLPFLDAENERRRNIHSLYQSAAGDDVRVLNSSDESFIAHLGVVLSNRRDNLRAVMREGGIATDVHYPIPDHKQRFPEFRPRPMPLEVTEWACQSVLSLPLFPEMTEQQVAAVTKVLERC